jgi:hypothetical protein
VVFYTLTIDVKKEKDGEREGERGASEKEQRGCQYFYSSCLFPTPEIYREEREVLISDGKKMVTRKKGDLKLESGDSSSLPNRDVEVIERDD